MFKLYKNKKGKNKRPTENHSIRIGNTIVAIIPDYIDEKFIRNMIKNLNSKKVSLPDVLN